MSISLCIVKEENKYVRSLTISIWSLWDIEIVKFIILGLNKLQTCSDSLENWNINKQILLCSKFVYAFSLQNSKTLSVTLSNCDKREKSKAKRKIFSTKNYVYILIRREIQVIFVSFVVMNTKHMSNLWSR